MKLISVRIKNFRCFTDREFNFYDEWVQSPFDEVCILGNNGDGKTSLLHILYFTLLSVFKEQAVFVKYDHRPFSISYFPDFLTIDESENPIVVLNVEHNSVKSEIRLENKQIYFENKLICPFMFTFYSDYSLHFGDVEKLQLLFKEIFGKELLYNTFYQLSQGQLRVVQLLSKLMIEKPQDSILFIDNLELFLHPTIAVMLRSYLVRYCNENNNQLFYSTMLDEIWKRSNNSSRIILWKKGE